MDTHTNKVKVLLIEKDKKDKDEKSKVGVVTKEENKNE